MRLARFMVLPLLVCAIGLAAQAQIAVRSEASQSCPVTTAKGHSSFIPPSPYLQRATPKGTFWYGSKELWTALDTAADTWSGERQSLNAVGYVAKLTYWAENFDRRAESKPKLRVIARRLDKPAEDIIGDPAHVVFVTGPMPAAMMSAIAIPVSGCWQITASYRNHKLSFVRRVLIQR